MEHRPFFQVAPILGNQCDDDDILQSVLQVYLSEQCRTAVMPELRSMGTRVVGREMLDACQDAETHTPIVEDYDSFGNRVSRLRTAAGWKHMKRVAHEEGLVSIAFERKYGAESRLVQFAKYHIYHPSSACFMCPLAMTDGAARLLELSGQHHEVQRRLISRETDMYTSGQWMTERGGGSDLSNSETIAKRSLDRFSLHGFKWFSSATDADVALSLATTKEGISLFLINVKEAGSTIRIARLKKKLGTHALPTAELELSGVPATLIGEAGKGIKTISTILNITRIYTAASAVSNLRRTYAIALAYSKVRLINRTQLLQKPLHAATLARIYTTLAGIMHLTFYLVSLLGKDECGTATPNDRALLRGLTPLVKAFVSRVAHVEVGECCEALGGLGYIENSDVEFNTARLYRDSLVLCIWEGTTNVLALDFARALASHGVRDAIAGRFHVKCELDQIQSGIEARYKDVMFDVARKVTQQLLKEAATTLNDARLEECARRWDTAYRSDERKDVWLLSASKL